MRNVKTLFLAAVLFGFGFQAQALEFAIQVPTFSVVVNDTANFKEDGTPLRQRWGLCQYEVTVESEAGDYKTSWRFARPQGHPSSALSLDFLADKALPSEGVYGLTVKVTNSGTEGGRLVTKSTPGALAFKIRYTKPEIALVTPEDLTEAMVSVVENETQF